MGFAQRASSLAGIIAAVAHQVPAIGIGSETIRGMAAVALIALMRGVAARQASIAVGETTVVAVS